MTRVVDASIALKWFLPEPDSLAEARQAMLITADRRLHARTRGTRWQPCVTLLAELDASPGDQAR